MPATRTITLVQLPFRSLGSYFPAADYFDHLENWYSARLEDDCVVPADGIWEVPLWISWLKCLVLAATRGSVPRVTVEVLDLSHCPFDVEAVVDILPLDDPSAVIALSPLTQNSELASSISRLARGRGLTVLAGGAVAQYLEAADYTSVFVGRPELRWSVFVTWIAELLELQGASPWVDPNLALSDELDHSWARERYAQRVIYPRVFTHHGCPYSCTFCADRRSGSYTLPNPVLYRDLQATLETFRERRSLYIGDLTFGISPPAVKNLHRVLSETDAAVGHRPRLAVQTNLALINETFVESLLALGVAVVEVGIETGSPAAAEHAAKRSRSSTWVDERLRLLLDADIAVAGNLIVGLPDDNSDDLFQTEELLQKWRNEIWFNIYGFVPYPGTPVFSRLVREDRIRNWDYSEWCEGAELVFDPYRITRLEVGEWLEKLVREALEVGSVALTA